MMAASSSSKQSDYARSIFRPNLSGTAYQRHQAHVRDFVSVYGGKSASSSAPRRTEFDILKEKHKFIREDDTSSKPTAWEDALAVKYESSLFKEYAVCDLKHYKSGNVALRWRTEAEVLSGAGEETCGNTRCAYHEPQSERALPPLSTLEVPFAYSEHGEAKSALVKLVVCERCSNKLLWKRRKEKTAVMGKDIAHTDPSGDEANENGNIVRADPSTSRQSGAEQRSYPTDPRGRNAGDHMHPGRAERSRLAPRSRRRSRIEHDDAISGQRHKDRRRPRQSGSVSTERRSASPEVRGRDG